MPGNALLVANSAQCAYHHVPEKEAENTRKALEHLNGTSEML